MGGPEYSDVETRFSRIRKKLDDGGYLESFGLDSLRLVEHLFNDLVKTTESLQTALVEYGQYKKVADELEDGVAPFKEENVRLYKENSQLRMGIARAIESAEDKARDPVSRLQELEAENIDLKLLVSQFAERVKKAEIESLEKTKRIAKLQEKDLGANIVITGERVSRGMPQLCKQSMEVEFFVPDACPNCIRLRNYVEYGKKSDRNPQAVDYMKLADSRIEALQLQLRSLKNSERENMSLISSLKSRVDTRESEIEKLRELIKVRPGRDNLVNAFAPNWEAKHNDMERGLAVELKTAELQLQIMQRRNLELEEKLKKSILQEHEDFMLGRTKHYDFRDTNVVGGFLEKELDKYPSHDKMSLLEKLYYLERQLSHCCKEKAMLKKLLDDCRLKHGTTKLVNGDARHGEKLNAREQAAGKIQSKTTTRLIAGKRVDGSGRLPQKLHMMKPPQKLPPGQRSIIKARESSSIVIAAAPGKPEKKKSVTHAPIVEEPEETMSSPIDENENDQDEEIPQNEYMETDSEKSSLMSGENDSCEEGEYSSEHESINLQDVDGRKTVRNQRGARTNGHLQARQKRLSNPKSTISAAKYRQSPSKPKTKPSHVNNAKNKNTSKQSRQNDERQIPAMRDDREEFVEQLESETEEYSFSEGMDSEEEMDNNNDMRDSVDDANGNPAGNDARRGNERGQQPGSKGFKTTSHHVPMNKRRGGGAQQQPYGREHTRPQKLTGITHARDAPARTRLNERYTKVSKPKLYTGTETVTDTTKYHENQGNGGAGIQRHVQRVSQDDRGTGGFKSGSKVGVMRSTQAGRKPDSRFAENPTNISTLDTGITKRPVNKGTERGHREVLDAGIDPSSEPQIQGTKIGQQTRGSRTTKDARPVTHVRTIDTHLRNPRDKKGKEMVAEIDSQKSENRSKISRKGTTQQTQAGAERSSVDALEEDLPQGFAAEPDDGDYDSSGAEFDDYNYTNPQGSQKAETNVQRRRNDTSHMQDRGGGGDAYSVDKTDKKSSIRHNIERYTAEPNDDSRSMNPKRKPELASGSFERYSTDGGSQVTRKDDSKASKDVSKTGLRQDASRQYISEESGQRNLRETGESSKDFSKVGPRQSRDASRQYISEESGSRNLRETGDSSKDVSKTGLRQSQDASRRYTSEESGSKHLRETGDSSKDVSKTGLSEYQDASRRYIGEESGPRNLRETGESSKDFSKAGSRKSQDGSRRYTSEESAAPKSLQDAGVKRTHGISSMEEPSLLSLSEFETRQGHVENRAIPFDMQKDFYRNNPPHPSAPGETSKSDFHTTTSRESRDEFRMQGSLGDTKMLQRTTSYERGDQSSLDQYPFGSYGKAKPSSTMGEREFIRAGDADTVASYGGSGDTTFSGRGHREIPTDHLGRRLPTTNVTSQEDSTFDSRYRSSTRGRPNPYVRDRIVEERAIRSVGVNTEDRQFDMPWPNRTEVQEKKALTDKISILQRKLDELHSECSRHQLKTFELQGELERTKHILQVEKEERELEAAELKRLREQHSESTARLLMNSVMGSEGSYRRGMAPMEMEREIANLRAALTNLDRDKDEMRVELDRKDEKLARVTHDASKYMDEVTQLKLRLKNAELQISHTGESAQEQGREAEFLKKQLESNRRDLVKTTKERDDAIKELHKMSGAHAQGQMARRSVESELEVKSKEADDLRKQVQRYIDEVRRIEELLLDKEEEMEMLIQHYRSLSAENSHLEAQRTNLEREASSIRDSVRDTVDQNIGFKTQIASQSALVQNLEEEIERLTQHISHLENETESKVEKEKMLESDVKASKDLLYRLEVQMDKLKLDMADCDSKRKQLEAENIELHAHIASLDTRLQEETDRQVQLEELVANSREKDFQTERTTIGISRERDELTEKLTNMQQRSETLNTEVSRYRLKSIELQNELDRTRRLLESEKRDRETALTELKKVREQLHSSSANYLINSVLGSGSSSSQVAGILNESSVRQATSSSGSGFRHAVIAEARGSREHSPLPAAYTPPSDSTLETPVAASTARNEGKATDQPKDPSRTEDEFEPWDSPK